MRLTKLKLAGFKSFVDPTTVLLPGQLVGVVGPNGCGKSNIMDAVRWVLGETKASELRGDSMQDVIFNGSGNRKPVGRASVELVFDNSLGRAMGQWSQYAEIAVKRILDRQGNSSYHINNVQVRRKDVIDVFLGTGLGPRAYAIIGQGMISRIIEARPEELRLFLEEAAGVTRYRERRKETEGRLSDARENLDRLEDIRNELEGQIGRLEVQAEVASRYQGLSEELARQQALLWYVRGEAAASEVARLAGELQAGGLRIEEETTRLRALEAALEETRSAHYAASDNLHAAQSAYYAANAEVARLEGELSHRRDTRQRLEARLKQLADEEHLWRAREEEAGGERLAWQERAEEAAERKEMAEARHEETGAGLPGLEEARRLVESALQAARREMAGLEQQARVEETHRANARRALEGIGQRQARLHQELAALSAPDLAALDELKAKEAELDALMEAGRRLLSVEQAALPEVQARLRQAQEAEKAAVRRLTETRARRDALVQLQEKVGREPALEAWKAGLGIRDAMPLWRELQVEPGWETALEAVLRERLSALDVPAEKLAVALAEPPKGAVVLASGLEAASREAALKPGRRPFFELLQVSGNWRTVLEDWLGPVQVVEDVAAWVDRRGELEAGEVLVDRQGHILGRQGLAFHAPDARTHGVLERQEEIQALGEELTGLSDALARFREAVLAAEAELGVRQETLARLRREAQEGQQQAHAVELEVVRLTQARQRHEERLARFHLDREELAEARFQEEERLALSAVALEELEEKQALLEEKLEGMDARQRQAEQALREARVAEQAAARTVQEAEFACREAAGRLQELDRGAALARGQLERLAVERSGARAEAERLAGGGLEEALQEALEAKAGREAALAASRDALEGAGAALRRQEEDRLRLEQGLAPLREAMAELRLKEQAARLAEEQCRERLAEAGVDEAARATLAALVAEGGRGVKEGSLNGAISRLSREIAALGPVNLAALEEVVAARKRKGFLDEQSEDLNQAIATLEDAIRRMDRETRDQLKDTYDRVNAQFGTLFPELFGGGEACLTLTGEEILDAGVQVTARPPGKKNSTIHLLSGGEKALTAIALVFSLFQLNPAPFCLLDEVDAPLDDTNTERFCAMVKRMSAQTQFLFISHSRITMELAEQLVGVTMQESGVSRVVEVDMEEALKMRDAA